jgi:uncharacterized protein YndB with AHSA1/START domain
MSSPPRSREQAVKLETIESKTGRPWSAWLDVLDAFDVAAHGHTAAAKHLQDVHDVGAWWAQTLTVRYEQVRGLREVGQRDGGFELSVSRTIRATPEAAYAAVTEPAHWSRWFARQAEADVRVGGRYRTADGDAGEFLALDSPRRMRMSWEQAKHPSGSVVEITVTPKDHGRVVVRVTHAKLADAAMRDDLRGAWRWAMDSLRSYLETGEGSQDAG